MVLDKILPLMMILCSSLNGATALSQEELFDQQIGLTYRPDFKPDGPVNVTAQMYIRDFPSADITKGTLDVQITFRLRWNDRRLKRTGVGSSRLTLSKLDKIWIPDIFFRNELEAREHNVLISNSYARIEDNGDVLMSKRITLKTRCMSDISLFPYDTQECKLELASYKWTTDDVSLSWSDRPVSIAKDLYLPGYTLMVRDGPLPTTSDIVKTNTGEYSSLSVSFVLGRAYGHIVVHLYLPVVMFCVMAGFAAWMPAHSYATARIMLGLVCLIFITLCGLYTNFVLTPAVAYLKAIDIWHMVSCLFVFISLLETVAVSALTSSQQAMIDQTGQTLKQKFLTATLAAKVDWVFRIIYPLLLTIFYIAYEATYA